MTEPRLPRSPIPDALVMRALTMRERISQCDDVRPAGEQLAEQLAGELVELHPLSFTEMGELVRAADRAGIPLGEWAMNVLLSAARLALLDASRLTDADEIPY